KGDCSTKRSRNWGFNRGINMGIRNGRRFLSMTAALALLAAAAVRGQPAAPQEDKAAIFRTDTRLVVLHATVVDKNGRFVTNIPQEAFTVSENGVDQQIKTFRREDVPVSMGLVVDNSGSMRDK